MRYIALWIIGLIVVGVASYWLIGRLSKKDADTPVKPSSPAGLQSAPTAPADPPAPQTETQTTMKSSSADSPANAQFPQNETQTTTKPTPSRKEKPPKIESFFSLQKISAKSSLPCEVVRHTYYMLCYVEAHEQPAWTAYVLDGQKLKAGNLRRTQDFREDPKVSTRSAMLADYRRSGYDRGHLVPAGDFKWDSVAMSETFYLSNMSPQLHEFNAGIWEAVERTARGWAKQKGRLVVYTGPLLRPNLKKIGNNVSVPDTFYKVIYAFVGGEVQAVGFLVPHRPFPENAVSRFMVPVDSVEKVTGIDFFPELPDDVEEKAERQWDRSSWPVRFTKR